jgi:hypothetical protein
MDATSLLQLATRSPATPSLTALEEVLLAESFLRVEALGVGRLPAGVVHPTALVRGVLLPEVIDTLNVSTNQVIGELIVGNAALLAGRSTLAAGDRKILRVARCRHLITWAARIAAFAGALRACEGRSGDHGRGDEDRHQ